MVIIVAADDYREYLLIQMTTAGACALAFGEAAVADEGVQMLEIGDAVHVKGAQARLAVYQIGENAAGTWQDGNITVTNGPNPSP